MPIPKRFQGVAPGYPRLPEGDPYVLFRYKQAQVFIDSIRRGESPSPNFRDGYANQLVLDAVAASSDKNSSWVEVPTIK
jgi:predicted dehydrogenase